MRIAALKHKALAVLTALVALSALGGPSTASAAGTSVTPTPSVIYSVPGTWSNSGATLADDTGPSPYMTSLLISDKNFLPEPGPEGDCAIPEDCTIRVDSESMLIEQLIDGGWGNPDTMVVQRGVNGTEPAYHYSGSPIQAHTVSASIYANGVTDSWGLGAFEVYMTLPPGVELIKMTAQSAWLGSTGRDVYCDGPHNPPGTSNWQITCYTMGNPEDGRYPIGPTGSGLIVKVILLPSQDLGLYTVSLAAQLLNTPGTVIPVTTQNLRIRVLNCPDANLDGWVDSGDLGQIARNIGDEGVDSGATLVDQVDTSQTIMAISDQSLLLLGDTIGVDAEQMTVQDLQEGTPDPDTMTVTRAVNVTPARSHSAGTHIYRATFDGNGDGRKAYTEPRDVNKDGFIDSGDYGLVARTMVMTCPEP